MKWPEPSFIALPDLRGALITNPPYTLDLDQT